MSGGPGDAGEGIVCGGVRLRVGAGLTEGESHRYIVAGSPARLSGNSRLRLLLIPEGRLDRFEHVPRSLRLANIAIGA